MTKIAEPREAKTLMLIVALAFCHCLSIPITEPRTKLSNSLVMNSVCVIVNYPLLLIYSEEKTSLPFDRN